MIEQINFYLFHLINQYAGFNLYIDTIIIIAAKYMPLIFIIPVVYLWFKKGGKNQDIALYSLYSATLGLIINFIIGLFYFHPRPMMLNMGTSLFPYSTDSSFPSDHTTMMLSIAFMLIYFRETRILGVLFGILALVGGFSRVFAGVHFPLDIIGSVMVSILASLIVYSLKDHLIIINKIIKALYFKILSNKRLNCRNDFLR